MSYGEGPKCFNETKRRARKDHKCCECRGVIKRGEEYIYSSGVWDRPESFKQCSECADIKSDAQGLIGHSEYDGICFGELYDTLFNDPLASDWLPLAKRYVDNAKARGGSLGRDNWMEKQLQEALQHTTLTDANTN